MGWLFRFIFGTLGIGIGLVLMLFLVFSIPLSVLSVMRWWQLDWWVALLAVLLGLSVPGFGQLAVLVVGGFGAYYLIAADYDWRSATYPASQTFAQRAYETYLDFCRNDTAQFQISGMSRAEYNEMCDCYANGIAGMFNEDDVQALANPTQEMIAEVGNMSRQCIEQARN